MSFKAMFTPCSRATIAVDNAFAFTGFLLYLKS